jgi:hypothetical protein
MLLNGQGRASETIGCSLPHRVATTIARRGGITKFLSRSDGGDEPPPVLLTGGLLVRVQPEEPFHRSIPITWATDYSERISNDVGAVKHTFGAGGRRNRLS